MSISRVNRPLAVGAAVVVLAGGAYAIVSSNSGTSSAAAPTAPIARTGANARSGPAAGGTIGKVSSVSGSSFTVTTAAGEKVAVKTASSTTYRNRTKTTSAGAVTKGAPVLVLGTTNGTAITAARVVVHPAGGGSAAYSPSKVVPFTRGAPTTAKQDGKIPANYTEGSGTIVSGASADRATTAALTTYPGGVVDRVVKLSNGEYEVHNIGVSWPHHVFVNAKFVVVGAD
jgi:hypothetical protein